MSIYPAVWWRWATPFAVGYNLQQHTASLLAIVWPENDDASCATEFAVLGASLGFLQMYIPRCMMTALAYWSVRRLQYVQVVCSSTGAS